MARFRRVNHGKGHSYTLDGHGVPGVTAIIGVLDKPALVNWAAEQSASFAVENWQRLSELPIVERAKQIQAARFQTNRAAIVKGNRIHAMAEQLQTTGRAPVEPDNPVYPQVVAVARMLDDWGMESLVTEAPICNTNYRYAGTMDSIVTSPRLGKVLIDWKTGKGVYDEVALQLGAYRAADLMLSPVEVVGPRGGKRTEWIEQPMPAVDGCYIAHVLGDAVELHPITVDDEVITAFLYLRKIYASWIERTSWKFRDSDSFAPTVGDPIYIEDRPIIREK